MKAPAVAVVVSLIIGNTAPAHGQCDDPFDPTLCVYPIPEADQQFRRDGQVSAFWSNWSGRDSIVVAPPDGCYPNRLLCGFTGVNDAVMQVRAAGTRRGLYVLIMVIDNVFVDRVDDEDWGADALDLYFDRMSAADIWSCTDCLIGLSDSKLTYTTRQFEVWMGAAGLPDGCGYAYYDDTLRSWETISVNWDTGRTLHGFEVDAIAVNSSTKAFEWFFPWEKYCRGISAGALLDSMRLAFSGGYNDKDGDKSTPDCLRWRGKDPWAGDANYWGDLLLLPGMGTVSSSQVDRPTPSCPGVLAWATGRHRPGFTLRYVLDAPERVVAELYTVKGELVRRLTSAHMPAGQYTLTWDGFNGSGTPVQGGLCVLRLRIGRKVIKRGVPLPHW